VISTLCTKSYELYTILVLQTSFVMSKMLKNASFRYGAPCASCVNQRSSETSVHTKSARRHIAEDDILHSHLCEDLKFYKENTDKRAISSILESRVVCGHLHFSAALSPGEEDPVHKLNSSRNEIQGRLLTQ
jgi:hypothetical protein